MSSLSNLQSLTRQQYRFDPNGRVFGDSELELYINQSYKTVQVELWLLLESKQTITTVSGTQEYTLPTNLYHISSVQFWTEELPQINYEDNDTTLSKPINYYIRETATGLSIGFSWIPDGAYSIEVYYKGYRADITSTTDASTPTQYDLLIALYSAYIAEYTLRGNSNNAVAKMQAYNQEKARLAKGRYKTNITFSYKR
jgi:hypothetical protein